MLVIERVQGRYEAQDVPFGRFTRGARDKSFWSVTVVRG
jgi:hypothetical protein